MDYAKKRHEVWARDFSLCTCSDTQTVLGFIWRLALGRRIRIQEAPLSNTGLRPDILTWFHGFSQSLRAGDTGRRGYQCASLIRHSTSYNTTHLRVLGCTMLATPAQIRRTTFRSVDLTAAFDSSVMIILLCLIWSYVNAAVDVGFKITEQAATCPFEVRFSLRILCWRNVLYENTKYHDYVLNKRVNSSALFLLNVSRLNLLNSASSRWIIYIVRSRELSSTSSHCINYRESVLYVDGCNSETST